MKIHHAAIMVRDLARAEAFYVKFLGLPLIARYHYPDGRHRSTWVQTDDSFIALEQYESDAHDGANSGPGLRCLVLGIEASERPSWRARLEESGRVIERETSFTMYIRDDEQNLIGLSHYPAPPTFPPSGPR